MHLHYHKYKTTRKCGELLSRMPMPSRCSEEQSESHCARSAPIHKQVIHVNIHHASNHRVRSQEALNQLPDFLLTPLLQTNLVIVQFSGEVASIALVE